MNAAYHGPERRETPMHMEPLAQCIERYNAIVEKLDGLVDRFDKINGRYDSHLVESVAYRAAVDAHTKRFDTAEDQTRWIIGVMVSIIMTIIIQISTFAFLWGQLTKRVEVNTYHLDMIDSSIDKLHPRIQSELKNGRNPGM
jgi:hypothetical protein